MELSTGSWWGRGPREDDRSVMWSQDPVDEFERRETLISLDREKKLADFEAQIADAQSQVAEADAQVARLERLAHISIRYLNRTIRGTYDPWTGPPPHPPIPHYI